MNCSHMGLFRWNAASCCWIAARETLPLGSRSLAGLPGMMRNRTKLNEATRTIVSIALATLRTK